MQYYLIAGEASGDMHAANLMHELKELDAQAEFRYRGGDLMKEEGGERVKHYREMAFMGFTEVVLNLRTILRNLKECKADLLKHRPDVLILIDYPGFNLRMARFARRNGIKVFYYISPQLWAWKQSRVKQIKACVDRMFVILPFEKEFYARFGVEVDYVGHPLPDALKNQSAEQLPEIFSSDPRPVVALLPGSRRQEIKRMLPEMLRISSHFPGYRFVVTGAPSQPEELYQRFIVDKHPNVELVFGRTYEVLKNARAALVTSGTATLETALLNVPQAVCYKAGYLSYRIARYLIKVPFISLVNLIMQREIVKEFIQKEMNQENLTKELLTLLENEHKRLQMLEDYENLRTLLGGTGASNRTASLMLNYLREDDEVNS